MGLVLNFRAQKFEIFKGIGGGVQVKDSDFSCFDMCYSSEYLVSRMGSLAHQLPMALEIWRDKVGHYSRNFEVLYGKNTPNDFSKFLGTVFYALAGQKIYIFVFKEDIMNI